MILKKNDSVNSGQDPNDSSANSDDVGMTVPHQNLGSAHSEPNYSELDAEGDEDQEFEVGPFNS